MRNSMELFFWNKVILKLFAIPMDGTMSRQPLFLKFIKLVHFLIGSLFFTGNLAGCFFSTIKARMLALRTVIILFAGFIFLVTMMFFRLSSRTPKMMACLERAIGLIKYQDLKKLQSSF